MSENESQNSTRNIKILIVSQHLKGIGGILIWLLFFLPTSNYKQRPNFIDPTSIFLRTFLHMTTEFKTSVFNLCLRIDFLCLPTGYFYHLIFTISKTCSSKYLFFQWTFLIHNVFSQSSSNSPYPPSALFGLVTHREPSIH